MKKLKDTTDINDNTDDNTGISAAERNNDADTAQDGTVDEKTRKKAKGYMLAMNIAALAVFIGVCAFITVKSIPYIKEFTESPQILSDYIKDNLFVGILVFLGIQILQIVVAVIPGEFVEIAAGAAFGWFFGFLLSMIGVAIATAIIFFVTRVIGKPLVYAALGEDKMKKLDRFGKSKRRDTVIFLLYLIPGIPKDLLTYAAPFFGIGLGRFLAITLIARIPSVISSTIAASYAMSGNFVMAAVIFLICGALAVIGYILSEKIMNKLADKDDKGGATDKDGESTGGESTGGKE